jgi:hypothetical protein
VKLTLKELQADAAEAREARKKALSVPIALTYTEAGELLGGIDHFTVARIAKKDPSFPLVLIGPKTHRIPLDALKRWLEAQINTGKYVLKPPRRLKAKITKEEG